MSDGRFDLGGRIVRCALGKGGVKPAADKREGDGASPLGTWVMRRILYRPDRGPPPLTALPAQAIAPDDGWCDAAADPNYNRPVKLPYPASAEHLWIAMQFVRGESLPGASPLAHDSLPVLVLARHAVSPPATRA